MDDQEPTRPLNLSTPQERPLQPDPALARPDIPASSSPLSEDLTQQLLPRIDQQGSPSRLDTRQQQLPPPIFSAGMRDEDGDGTLRKVGPPQLPPFGRMRQFLDSRPGRIALPLVTLVLGLILGLSSLLWYGLSGEGSVVIISSPGQGNLVIEAETDFVTQLVSQNLTHTGLPGKVQNVHVVMSHGAQMVITGDDVYSVLVATFSRHFTIDVKPYVQACILQMQVTHADIGNLPVTTFVQSFQQTINTQLSKKPAGLPDGFTYCAVGVSTETAGLFITYRATPISQG